MKHELLVRVQVGQNKGPGDDVGKRCPCRSVIVVQEPLPDKQVFQKELGACYRLAKLGVFWARRGWICSSLDG